MKSMAATEGIVVDRFHALAFERAGVLNGLLADAAPARLFRWIIAMGGLAAQHAARPEFLAKLNIPGIEMVLRIFLGVEVIEIAVEFIETVQRRQIFVAIAQVVLTKLAGGVAERLQ